MRISSVKWCVMAAVVFLVALPAWAEDGRETMKVVYTRSIDDLPLYVGLEEGFWEEEGLTVELVRLTGEQNIIAAALHGDIQAGRLDPGSFFHAVMQKIPIKIVAWLGHAHGGTHCGLHVDAASGIRTLKDLKGARVAEAGSITTAMILSEALSAGGLAREDIVAIKGIKLDDSMKHEAALRSKGVDVIVA
jgi:ABC-type nitrate/sulfonate/bicarbonate transport system substrate-binding protein